MRWMGFTQIAVKKLLSCVMELGKVNYFIKVLKVCNVTGNRVK